MVMQSLRAAGGRWLRLLGYRLEDSWKPLALTLAAAAVLDFLPLLMGGEPWLTGGPLGDSGLGWTLLVAGGAVLAAASAFRGFHGRPASDSILWPASSLEKYLAALAEALVAVPLVLTVGGLVISSASAALTGVVLGHRLEVWAPWDKPFWGLYKFIPWYGLFYLTGATVFRRLVVLKTTLVYLGVWTVSALVIVGLLMVDHGARVNPGTGVWVMNLGDRWSLAPWARGWIDGLMQFWIWGPTLLFCLGYGWAKTQEKEAGDEVQ